MRLDNLYTSILWIMSAVGTDIERYYIIEGQNTGDMILFS